jgi:D-serine dehydratase
VLAPHGKTPMSPQLWAMQLRAGAWGISVSSVQQMEVAIAFGVPRILLANQVVGAYELRRIVNAVDADSMLGLYLVVDSTDGVKRLKDAFESRHLAHPLRVLVEFGMCDGRAGVREERELVELAKDVLGAGPNFELAGVFGYEGIAPGKDLSERSENVETYLRALKHASQAVRNLVPTQREFIVSAGGSVYFDRVVAHLGKTQLPEAQLVLRPGAYLTHDSSFYERISPLAKTSPRFLGGESLQPALEIWSHVLSRPEPNLVILGMGGRDAPSDLEMPLATAYTHGTHLEKLDGEHVISKMNDQHAFMQAPASSPLAVGDRVVCGISHPCTSFDKWRQLFVVEDNYDVARVISTYF